MGDADLKNRVSFALFERENANSLRHSFYFYFYAY